MATKKSSKKGNSSTIASRDAKWFADTAEGELLAYRFIGAATGRKFYGANPAPAANIAGPLAELVNRTKHLGNPGCCGFFQGFAGVLDAHIKGGVCDEYETHNRSGRPGARNQDARRDGRIRNGSGRGA